MTAAAVELFRFPNLAAAPGIYHGISTRHGGVSEGRCATLNTSFTVDDEPERVEENLRRLSEAVGTQRERLLWAYQVHGNAVTQVEADTAMRPKCDALITDSPARALLLRYADCTPILIADTKRRAVAAVHAGWRGTALRAPSAAVQAMVNTFGSNPRDLVAGIGPAIGPCCYEVGYEVTAQFADRPWAVVPTQGPRPHLDLWEANRRDLLAAGIPADQVELARICTQCQSDRFFSHRANGGQPAGRFAAIIGVQ